MVTGLAAAQAALDHEVWIITNSHLGWEDHIAPWLHTVPGLDKVNVVSYVETSLAAPMAWLRQGWSMKQIVSTCDVVHLHGVWNAILWTAATIARRVGTPYTVTPHGLLDPWSLSQKRWKKELALSLGFRKMLAGAAFLHLLNQHELRLIEPLSLRGDTVVIPNGIFPDEFAQLPPNGSFLESFPNLRGRRFILFLGRLHSGKGLDCLVDAFSILSREHVDLDLVIAGPDSGELHNVETQVRGLRLEDRVHTVGPLYGHNKLAALTDASVFCLPSGHECFSISIIEALACRLPVVISPQCHFNEVAEVGAGEIANVEPSEISTAISRLIEDENSRKRAGEAGRALVLAHFTWPKIAATTINAYAHALGSNVRAWAG